MHHWDLWEIAHTQVINCLIFSLLQSLALSFIPLLCLVAPSGLRIESEAVCMQESILSIKEL